MHNGCTLPRYRSVVAACRNRELPALPEFSYLAGLAGSFVPFPLSAADRTGTGDTRRALAERYTSKEAYLDRIRQVCQALVARRLLLARDVDGEVKTAAARWDYVMAAVHK